MRSDLTDLTIVLDRSGSMSSCRESAEGGLNIFIQQQQEADGECRLTMVQFDTEYEVLHRAVPVKEVGRCSIVPRGGTALLDAVGKAITETGNRLRDMPESERPGLVVFTIITDGEENSSKEYALNKIHEMINHQRSVYSWEFTFLGANQDAFQAGQAMGFAPQTISSYSTTKTAAAFGMASSNVKRMRSARARGEAVCNSYTEAERLNAVESPDDAGLTALQNLTQEGRDSFGN